jgi:hypothetical protein
MLSNLETIINRHDPENDIIPGMDRRTSWAEAQLADAVKTLLGRVEELESEVQYLKEQNPGYWRTQQ